MGLLNQSLTRIPISRPLAVVLIAIVCASCGLISREETRPSTGSQASEIEITADALHASYIENRVAGDKRFRGQTVVISGRVSDIQMFGDRPMISLHANKGRGVIQCYFEPEQAESVKKIVPGQPVKIKGRCDGFIEGAVLVKECSMQ